MITRSPLSGLAIATAACLAMQPAAAQTADDGDRILRVEHFVPVHSMAPGMAGQTAQIHMRERVRAGTALRTDDFAGSVVLFVHGAGTPAEVAFDASYPGYSWMAFLAEAGFDAFAVNMTGYGRSTRPPAMNDPCALAEGQQSLVVRPPSVAPDCGEGDWYPITTIESDWADIDAAVEYIRSVRNVDRVSLIAWSLGGPRAGGYAARHPEKVDRLVLLAPAYRRDSDASRPAGLGGGAGMTVQTRAAFDANWDRQVGCEGQYKREVSDAVWRDMMASDAVGATWGVGMRRAPRVPTWGWNEQTVARTATPTLLISPAHDGQVPASRVSDLFEDLGSGSKVLIDLGCTSHNAQWEENRLLMYQASLEWLTEGSVSGETSGVLRMGY